VEVDLPRPRDRRLLNTDFRYKEIRSGVLDFLLRKRVTA
jgi:hypothetical protein